jgi:hypothetical protein
VKVLGTLPAIPRSGNTFGIARARLELLNCVVCWKTTKHHARTMSSKAVPPVHARKLYRRVAV